MSGKDTSGLAQDAWNTTLGMEITEASPDRVVGRVEIGPQHHQPYGITHGGVWCSIVETLASTGAAYAAFSRGQKGVVGVSNSTDFFRPLREGAVVGVAEPIHMGRTQQIWQVVIRRTSDEKVVSRGQVRLQVLDELPMERTGK